MTDSLEGVYPSNITINNSYFINLIGYSGGGIYLFGYVVANISNSVFYLYEFNKWIIFFIE